MKAVNKGRPLVVGKEVLLPSDKDLASVTLPDVEIMFDLDSPDFLRKLKADEGDEQYQSSVKSPLLGGKRELVFGMVSFIRIKTHMGIGQLVMDT